MAAKRKPATKRTPSTPKFGSPAWFARYPKAAQARGRMKAKGSQRKATGRRK